MILQEFMSKYNGKKIDFDGSFGSQCVDLFRFYVQEVLGFPQTPGVGGAYQIFDTAPADHFEKIKNTPIGVPKPGDIMIWEQSYGGYGHVGIVVSADVHSFTAFEQNDPVGSPCQSKVYPYTHVIGWLSPKAIAPTPTPTPAPQTISNAKIGMIVKKDGSKVYGFFDPETGPDSFQASALNRGVQLPKNPDGTVDFTTIEKTAVKFIEQ